MNGPDRIRGGESCAPRQIVINEARVEAPAACWAVQRVGGFRAW